MIQITKEYLDRQPRISSFVALTYKSDRSDSTGKWVLRLEGGRGWIFREWPDLRFGFNGRCSERIGIIKNAVESDVKPTVYSFQSQEELDEWLNTPI